MIRPYVYLAGVVLMMLLAPTGAAADPALDLDDGGGQLLLDVSTLSKQQGLEADQVMANAMLRQAADPLVRAVTSSPDAFGGIYVDYPDGNIVIHVQYVDNKSSAQAAVGDLVPNGLSISWDRVAYSYAHLDAVQDQILEEFAGDVIAVSVYEPTNRVVVSVPEENANIGDSIALEYGRLVTVRVDGPDRSVTCSGPDACTPYRGGTEAQVLPGDNSTLRVTFTLWAKNAANYQLKYLITAGHAGSAIGGTGWLTSQDFYHNGAFVGTSTVNSLELSNPRTDSRRIPNTGNTTQMNRIWYASSHPSYAITAKEGWATQIVGDYICKAGVGQNNPGTWCGTIINANTTFVTTTGQTIVAKQADFNGSDPGYGVSGGDSGATVFWNGVLMGLAVSGNGKYSVAAVDVESDIDVVFCLTANCN